MYIKNKTHRKIAAWGVALPIWLLLMYALGHLALYCITHMGLGGILPPLVVAIFILNLIEDKTAKIDKRRRIKFRRDKMNEILKRNYKEAGIEDRFKPLV